MIYRCDICGNEYSAKAYGVKRCPCCTHAEAGWRKKIAEERDSGKNGEPEGC